MTYKELAEKLDCGVIGKETTPELTSEARKHGLVVVYGYSDDLMVFEGAIGDERGAYKGSMALVDGRGLLPLRDDIEDDEVLENFFIRRKTAKEIKAIWGGDKDFVWTYQTDIPHATFRIFEDGEPYCRGIVFKLSDTEAPNA